MRATTRAIAFLLALVALAPGGPSFRSGAVDVLGPGLELLTFVLPQESIVGDSTVTILRIDPVRWRLSLHSISEIGIANVRSAREWCEEEGLVAAMNAGMFATDRSTHVGYMRSGKHVNSGGVNRYQSVAAFDPRGEGSPPFRIYDRDDGATTVAGLTSKYGSVVQNLRLVKRPRTNRWSQQPKMWSEAALGEDGQGRVLFIFCRSPYSMHDLNRMLVSLPIDLVCAQHLEGGPEAQMWIDAGGVRQEHIGSYETGFFESDANIVAWPIPNVIGVSRRAEAE